MDAISVLGECRRRGLALEVEAGQLVVLGSGTKSSATLLKLIADHREALANLLTTRPPDSELDRHLDHQNAEGGLGEFQARSSTYGPTRPPRPPFSESSISPNGNTSGSHATSPTGRPHRDQGCRGPGELVAGSSNNLSPRASGLGGLVGLETASSEGKKVSPACSESGLFGGLAGGLIADDDPDDPSTERALPTWWRPLVARKPPADRERWGRRANELAESGTPFPEDERLAFLELFGEPATIPAPAADPGLDPRAWSADGRSWADPGEAATNFDPCPLVWPPPPRDRAEDESGAMPRPYLGRKRKGPEEGSDREVDALAEVESWAECGREFMESAPGGRTPEHVACLYRLGAGMFARAVREAEDQGVGGSDPALAAGLAAELEHATRLGSRAGWCGAPSGMGGWDRSGEDDRR